MADRESRSPLFWRTAGGAALALLLVLAWCAPAPAAPKRVGNVSDDAADAPAVTDPDDAAAEDTTDNDEGEEARSSGPKKVGNADGDVPAAGEPAARDDAATNPEEMLDAEPADGKAANPAEEKAAEPAPSDAAKPAAPAAPAKPAPAKPKQKKGKDFVKKADQRRDDKGVYRFESGAYIITTDVDKDLANDIAAHMDSVYKEYWSRLKDFRPNPYAAVKPDEKMPLYVMRRYRDYLTLLQGFGFNAANSGGVFFRSRNGSGLATWVEGQSRLKMYYVLQHEGFHQFADARLMGSVQLANGTVVELPPWVNEGLAEFFGDAVIVKGKMIIGRLDRERLNRMKRAIKEEITLPFRELLTMDNDRWVARVRAGDKASSLMYDSAWSVCYYLINGNKKERLAIETYLRMLNDKFVTDPGRDPRAETFEFVFGNNLDAFEAAWKAAVARMEPDSWFTSVRHLQWMAAALKQFRDQEIEVRSWPHLKEQLIRHKFKATIRERDIVARGERKEQVEHLEQDFDFPDPAQVEFLPSDDPRLPHGLLITHVSPNILLSWSINADGVLEEDISYLDPPRGQIKKSPTKNPRPVPPVAGKSKPEAEPKAKINASPKTAESPKKPETPKKKAAPATAGKDREKPAKKGTIKVGPG
jgi:hypothetical protein